MPTQTFKETPEQRAERIRREAERVQLKLTPGQAAVLRRVRAGTWRTPTKGVEDAD